MTVTQGIAAPLGGSERGGELLPAYRPGASFLFASARSTLLAEDVALTVPHVQPGSDPGVYVEQLLRGLSAHQDAPIAVGVVPFVDVNEAHLVIPRRVRTGDRASAASLTPTPSSSIGELVCSALPSPEAYTASVASAVERIACGDVTKVVLARSLFIESPEPIDISAVVRRLARADTRAFVFAADLPGDRVLVGASPELVVRRTGNLLTTQPMAGSTPRAADPAEDADRAATLRTSSKDRHEHALVVKAIVACLRPFARRMEVPAEPSVIGTPTMWHLATTIRVELADPAPSALTAALAIHPTPAVCGTPVDKALALIHELEPLDRGYYSGLVGWMDAAGDGEWALAIRCAEISGSSARLYAGAGIVAGSRPGPELAETEHKFATMMRALGEGE